MLHQDWLSGGPSHEGVSRSLFCAHQRTRAHRLPYAPICDLASFETSARSRYKLYERTTASFRTAPKA